MGWPVLEAYLIQTHTTYALMGVLAVAFALQSWIFSKLTPPLDRLQLLYAVTLLLCIIAVIANIATWISAVGLIACISGLLGTLAWMALMAADAVVIVSLIPRWFSKTKGQTALQIAFLTVSLAVHAVLYAAFSWTVMRCTV